LEFVLVDKDRLPRGQLTPPHCQLLQVFETYQIIRP